MMQLTKRVATLGLVALLAACSHKDKDAPLAFAPADTPYVMANLDVLDDATRAALLAQADAQMPSELARINAAADQMAAKDPDGARLLHAFAGEFKNQTVESFATSAGLNLKGLSAFYGIGLAPVVRFELNDPAAFDAFISRLETAYGKKLDVASEGKQSYRKYRFAASGTELIVATVDKQAVAALLPADPSQALLRQALGLDRPQHSLQDDGRLATLAKAKGYQKWLIGDLDLTRALPLAFDGKDPLIAAIRKARAEAESAKTGEPVANQLKVSPSCATDAARIAARIPALAFGYTKLDAKHQDMQFDLALASDISKPFAGLKVNLPGLGAAGTSPFDLSVALPVAQLRTFWLAQADAVAAKPFSCPAMSDLNQGFAKLGPLMQKAAIPPFGDILGLRIALDSLSSNPQSSLPSFSGRIVLGTSNPAGLLAMGQMMVPALAKLKPAADGTPQALSKDLNDLFGQPGWIAMSDSVLALGVGAGEAPKLADTLKDPVGGLGQMSRMHIDGNMYVTWLDLAGQKADALAAATAAMSQDDDTSDDAGNGDATRSAADLAQSKAQLKAMKEQAERIVSIDGEVHVTNDGLVITSQTALK